MDPGSPPPSPSETPPTPEENRAYEAGFICGLSFMQRVHDHDAHSDPVVSAGYVLGWFWRALAEPDVVVAAPKSAEDAVARVGVIEAFGIGFRDAYNSAHSRGPSDGDEGEGGIPPSGPATKPKDDGLPSMYN